MILETYDFGAVTAEIVKSNLFAHSITTTSTGLRHYRALTQQTSYPIKF